MTSPTTPTASPVGVVAGVGGVHGVDHSASADGPTEASPHPSPDRARWGRIGAHESWARTEDRAARTAPARKAMLDRFEREVDPTGRLSPVERAKRAESAKRAHFTRLAIKSAASRRIRAQLEGKAS